jgi:hypothetical protein
MFPVAFMSGHYLRHETNVGAEMFHVGDLAIHLHCPANVAVRCASRQRIHEGTLSTAAGSHDCNETGVWDLTRHTWASNMQDPTYQQYEQY